MSWIFEGPWPILLTALVLEAILLIALVRTGRAVLLWAIGGLGLLAAGLLVLERAIVTENERISAALDGLAVAAEANDLEAVLSFIAPDADPVRRMAIDGLRRVKVREAKIGNDLVIRITQQGGAPSALATFTGRFRLESNREALGHENFVGRFQVGLVKRGDKWLIVAVDRRDFKHP
jgi:ketosteroid isomerase-like protein